MADVGMSARVPSEAAGGSSSVADFFALMKPRVMSLVVFTALVGMLAAPGSLHPVLAIISIVCIAVGAGASAPSTCGMTPTSMPTWPAPGTRPIPEGRLTPDEALAFGTVLAFFSVLTWASSSIGSPADCWP